MTTSTTAWTNKCSGSQEFPTSFDGEYTKCQTCGRKLKLHRNGKVPNHNAETKG